MFEWVPWAVLGAANAMQAAALRWSEALATVPATRDGLGRCEMRLRPGEAARGYADFWVLL